MAIDLDKLKNLSPPKGMEFHIAKVGHGVSQVGDLERATEFYTQVLGFKVSGVYSEKMLPGGMALLRCNSDHHCLALVGQGDRNNSHRELHHLAFAVPTRAEVLRARPPQAVWRQDRLRGASPCRLSDRRRVPRPGHQPAGNLLGSRSGRQRWPRPASERVAWRSIAGYCLRPSGAWPGHAYP